MKTTIKITTAFLAFVLFSLAGCENEPRFTDDCLTCVGLRKTTIMCKADYDPAETKGFTWDEFKNLVIENGTCE